MLVDCLYAFGRESERDGFLKLGDVNLFLLEISRASHFATRVKLRRASAVGISASDKRCLFCNRADSHG